ncbi:DUF255 domain-containing protein [Bacillus xiamenensis]|uniref:DUF255 domain-containing protein n=1 Tax=Bacillus TaxID=1386 RepID=UPI00028CF4EE|nr:hypothetical protein BA1_12459 [Bacillus xiamenensis]QGX67281.1 DUF255 domain-containing protein [Bacillus sp. ms-22]
MSTNNKPNRLITEKSPYLLQHALNPVNWYPWGKEAFDKAKRENKPVLVSIGYATCHWCPSYHTLFIKLFLFITDIKIDLITKNRNGIGV